MESSPHPVKSFNSSADWKTHFDSLKDSNKLMVVDFMAKSCGPCKFIEPFIIEMAENFTDVVFVKIDVDELEDVSREYGVQAMPTFLLLKQGKEVDRLVGGDKEKLKEKIEKHRPNITESDE